MTLAETEFVAEVPPPLGRDPNPGLWITFWYVVYDVIFSLAILAASPWWVGRSLFDRGFRAMVIGRLFPNVPARDASSAKQRVLIHGVSVGEVMASKSLVRALSDTHDVIVSASTNTGLQVAKKLYEGGTVVRFPIDHMRVVSRFLRRMRPDLVVLMELEIWPNFLRRANRMGIPIAIVSGRITESSYRNYRRFGKTLPQFNRVTVFGAQDERYAERFASLARSSERVVVTGNVKADGLRIGAVPRDAEFERLEALAAPRPGGRVIVCGSTHEPEERLVVETWLAHVPNARLILVPRHPERTADLVGDLAALGPRPQRLTELRAGTESPDPERPLLADTIGEMDRLYALADLVFVGGSLVEHGGQNVLEPAAQGLPVLHGPHVWNFSQEVALLADAGGAQGVEDAADLGATFARLLEDDAAREAMAAASSSAVESQRGATRVTLEMLSERCGLKL
ncbi:MAG: 3-deoxy-D-manno-octulosonic acid transferase [bacterium]|nr:3-deoxy-D-manno-octulosonic acid transferase [bacterium]